MKVAIVVAGAVCGVGGGVCLAADGGEVGDAGVAPEAPAAAPSSALDVTVVAPPPPRSASEARLERPVLAAAPHHTAGDLIQVVPGVFITQHGGEGKAYQIFYRGFDAVHGQDLEIWAGGAPMNDVSNIHGQGYADLQFLPAEIVRRVTALPGPYDPRQGDFAVAGTLRLELGYEPPGLTVKVGAGSFGTRRAFLAYRPPSADEQTFGAVEVYSTDGFGPSRAGTRASAVGQMIIPLGADTTARLLATAGSSRFSSAGVLRLADIESGAVSRTSAYDGAQGTSSARTQIVGELVRRHDEDGELRLTAFLVFRSLMLRQNFTGFLSSADGDTQQQVNDALVLGATGAYRRRVRLFSPRDAVELGFFGRNDWIDQSQRRLATADGRVIATEVDARVRARDVAGYGDLTTFPLPRLALRLGVRVDGLGYLTQDFAAGAAGQARGAQGTHIGKKATVDVRLGRGFSALASWGEGFRSPQARSLADGETTPFTSVTSGEVGVRYAGERVRASAAGFVTALSEDLVFDQATARYERVPATRRWGGALDVVATPRPWLLASASSTVTRAVFTEGSATYAAGGLVPYAPQFVARADVAATPGLGIWWGREVRGRAGAGASWLARRPLPYGEWGHDVFLLDAAAGLRVGAVEVGVEAFNLLDAAWFDGEFVYPSRWDPAAPPSLVPARHVTVGAPRTVLLTVALFL